MLHYLRIREWQDLVSQLRRVAKDIGLTRARRAAAGRGRRTPAAPGDAGRAAVPSSGCATRATRDYLGARGARFVIWPGSALRQEAAGLGRRRRAGRDLAALGPGRRAGPARVGRAAGRRTWCPAPTASRTGRPGAVRCSAYERVTLYGLPLVTQRRVGYGAIDPEVSRELFIRHALVEGEWTAHHAFVRGNARRVAEVERLEARARRRDLLGRRGGAVRLLRPAGPENRCLATAFRPLVEAAPGGRARPARLRRLGAAAVRDAPGSDADAFPLTWAAGDVQLPLTYQFEPGEESDGVTVHVPLEVLGQLDPDPFSWQVPGLREELVTALIRSLPKAIRRSYVPAPNFATAALWRAGRPGRDRATCAPRWPGRSRAWAAAGSSPSDWDLARRAQPPADDLRVHATRRRRSPVLGDRHRPRRPGQPARPAHRADPGCRGGARSGPTYGAAACAPGRRASPTTCPTGSRSPGPARSSAAIRPWSTRATASRSRSSGRRAGGRRRATPPGCAGCWPSTCPPRRRPPCATLTNQQRLALGAPPHTGGTAALLGRLPGRRPGRPHRRPYGRRAHAGARRRGVRRVARPGAPAGARRLHWVGGRRSPPS